MREPIMDECLQLLADSRRRRVIRCLQAEGGTTVEDLAVQLLADIPDNSREKIHTELHHTHLPKLQSYGIVDYDRDSGAVRYHAHDGLEQVLDSLPEQTLVPPAKAKNR
ncbi:DUF7344 domain-containing protein [Halapricum hydrolyticum]|uniref:ArsR family transcriptional regulator n=1 Tax=Halapricum hydrolyticum TaxID=2979991 RepID=A0AAE3ICI4_9EURY|nr:ArsR family transcriptional regulator [Halapricum hydrolyticum]MCU4719594.1 ArsR family transcriptional regulator [Halapricum hydrolyticum]MCU4728110.1 ArsR family transcriptional regulator [Halapricum hydrolyticum]